MPSVTLNGVSYSGTSISCSVCHKPVGYAEGCCQCGTRGFTTSGTGWIVVDGTEEETDDPPGILSDIPAMRERAERVRARAVWKDLGGEDARQLACDVLSLIEALEELG